MSETFVTLYDYCSSSAEGVGEYTMGRLEGIRARLGQHARELCIDEAQQKVFEDDPNMLSYYPRRGLAHLGEIADHWLLMAVRADCQKCLNDKCKFRRNPREKGPYR